MKIYSCAPTLSQISLKNSFGKEVFQILAKIKTMQNKNRLFGHHFETAHIKTKKKKESGIMVSNSAYIYGANFIAKFRWESGFLGGSMEPPLGTKGVKIPWSLKC